MSVTHKIKCWVEKGKVVCEVMLYDGGEPIVIDKIQGREIEFGVTTSMWYTETKRKYKYLTLPKLMPKPEVGGHGEDNKRKDTREPA